MLPPSMSGGPHNLGDPDDMTLRKVESEVLIPAKMRDKTKQEKCIAEGEAFTQCCKSAKFWMVWSCKKETDELTACIQKWYQNDDFKKECTEEYLRERSEYRRTGIKRNLKKKEPATF